ncbi:hypothetical protein ACTXG7_11630 [Mycolicibacterium sp. Dal123E01]|uniref:hypothetical protein n=1 Tax=Mycolicibacterium sp. Dal123E01 TaxID=3457578 RepID=UPI00403E9402
MVYPAHVVHVLIASPSDVSAERAALRVTLWEFNDEHTPTNQVVMLPRTWEQNSTPRLGADPQVILDEQIVDSSDIAIGIFWTRIGQMLPDGTPATVHELERLVEAGKPVLLYFSNTPVVPGSIDAEQWAAVLEFKERAKSWGIYGEYSGIDELIERARRDLLSTVRDRLHLPQVTAPVGRKLGARPIARVEKRQNQRVDSKGALKIENLTYLVIENKGTGDAKNLRMSWASDDEDGLQPPIAHDLEKPVASLVVDGQIEISLMLHSATADRCDLHIRWDELDGRASESTQTLGF